MTIEKEDQLIEAETQYLASRCEHDCTLSPEDGCSVCEEMYDEGLIKDEDRDYQREVDDLLNEGEVKYGN